MMVRVSNQFLPCIPADDDGKFMEKFGKFLKPGSCIYCVTNGRIFYLSEGCSILANTF
jgi:hypothetical protein